jgi:hypothetical protein
LNSKVYFDIPMRRQQMHKRNSHHPDPNDPDAEMGELDDQFPEGMFRFEKKMK